MRLIKIIKSGQLKVGDRILICDHDKMFKRIVRKVIGHGEKEEILTNIAANQYFITKMLLEGSSWAKEVYKIDCGLTKEPK